MSLYICGPKTVTNIFANEYIYQEIFKNSNEFKYLFHTGPAAAGQHSPSSCTQTLISQTYIEEEEKIMMIY